jgi:DNA-binding HxlR family transcriptional regulator
MSAPHPPSARPPVVLSALCPSRDALRHATSTWALLVFYVLREGPHRFSELRRRIDGVSERMLAQTLKVLAQDGFVLRTAHAVVPPHVDYELTALGREMAARAGALAEWIEANTHHIQAARARAQQE